MNNEPKNYFISLPTKSKRCILPYKQELWKDCYLRVGKQTSWLSPVLVLLNTSFLSCFILECSRAESAVPSSSHIDALRKLSLSPLPRNFCNVSDCATVFFASSTNCSRLGSSWEAKWQENDWSGDTHCGMYFTSFQRRVISSSSWVERSLQSLLLSERLQQLQRSVGAMIKHILSNLTLHGSFPWPIHLWKLQ